MNLLANPCLKHPKSRFFEKTGCEPCYKKFLYETDKEFREAAKARTSNRRALLTPEERCAKNKAEYEKYRSRILAHLKEKAKRRTPEETYQKHLKDAYNLTLADYKAMWEAQNGCCAICKEPSYTRLEVDHDHFRGQVRKLLCGRCNKFIGYIETSSREWLISALAYLGLPETYVRQSA